MIIALAYVSIGVFFAVGDAYTEWPKRKNEPVWVGLLIFFSLTVGWPLIVVTMTPRQLRDWFRKKEEYNGRRHC